MKKHLSKSLVYLGLAAALMAPPLASAQTFYISDGGDGLDTTPLGDGVCNPCTLRAAIQEANAYPGEDTIDLAGYDIVLTRPGLHENESVDGDLDIKDHLIIRGSKGNGARNTINGSNQDRIFHILNGAKVTIENVKVTNGLIDIEANGSDGTADEGLPTGGAGIQVRNGELTLKNVEIVDNGYYAADYTYTTSGGGLYVGQNGIARVENSVISRNVGPAGGGITNLGTITVLDTIMESNEARGGLGGAIENLGGYLNIGGSTLSNNTASQGGAIFSSGLGVNQGNTIITNTNIEYNSVTQFGGGIYNLGPMTVSNSSINNNFSSYDGAGVYNLGLGNIDIINTTISTNDGRSGGGIYNTRSVSLTNVTLFNNKSSPCTSGCGNADNGSVGGNQIALFNSSQASEATVTLSNTIIADGPFSNPTQATCAGSTNYEFYIISRGRNIDSKDSCGLIDDWYKLSDGNPNTTAVYMDRVNETNFRDNLEALVIDPAHPTTTPIHPFVDGNNVAVDAGYNCPITDQRFLQRDTDLCDIGAVEYNASTPLNPDLVDLKVGIKDNLDPAEVNDDQTLLAYTVTVTNLYDKTAFGIFIEIELPVSYVFFNVKTATSGDEIFCNGVPNAANVLTCSMFSLEALGRVDITVSGVPTVEETIFTTAKIIFANDAFEANNRATEDTKVERGTQNVHNFGGNTGGSGGGGVLNPLILLLMSGLFYAIRNRH